jgi:2-keto-3-deoxy-L-rhamnonate aldolase RhmA
MSDSGAPGLRLNPVKRALREGRAVYGTFVTTVHDPAIAQVLARCGFDCFFIDAEHGAWNRRDTGEVCRVARLCGIVPFVRACGKEYWMLTQPLDDGAQGIMVPFTDTGRQAQEIVQCVKYPPVGRRGCSTAAVHGEFAGPPVKEFMELANQETLVVGQIETDAAVQAIDDIVSTPGIDAVFIGPNDLSISLGLPGGFDHPEVNARIERVLAACRRRGVAAGMHSGDPQTLRAWRERGMQLLCCSADVALLLAEGQRLTSALRAP